MSSVVSDSMVSEDLSILSSVFFLRFHFINSFASSISFSSEAISSELVASIDSFLAIAVSSRASALNASSTFYISSVSLSSCC